MNDNRVPESIPAESATTLRALVREHQTTDETELLKSLVAASSIDTATHQRISARAEELVVAVRDSSDPAMLESFLAEYGLSTDEGVALMCLAEALLRVPDNETVDALIHDKITPADWGKHLGRSSSSLVNASTWALMLTGTIIADEPEGIVGSLRGAVRRLGEPVIRTAVNQAIKEMGNQFVLGEDIDSAMSNSQAAVNRGFTYSYDMLGEAALTDADAKRYHLAYSEAVSALGKHCTFDTVAENPGISVKLSALYPRYEFRQHERVMVELVSRTRSLAMLAKSANMGFNIDAEEADRLDLSLDVIEAVLASPGLADWEGFGIVVQAYSKRATFVIDWLYDMAKRLDRRIMVRLVKGAYWDTEIKQAQVEGLEGFPVFTRKCNTDISYICCAEKLLGMADRIYPQFATHNAHSVAAIYELADKVQNGNHAVYEFQRLHGMGDTLHRLFHEQHGTRCRIYAPVGAHVDLLAYLVRRLLENGANSSFVNQLVDENITPSEIASDPFTEMSQLLTSLKDTDRTLSHPGIPTPIALFAPERKNSKGLDLSDPIGLENLAQQRLEFSGWQWRAQPVTGQKAGQSAKPASAESEQLTLLNPATGDAVGTITQAQSHDVDLAFNCASEAFSDWADSDVSLRADCLDTAADLYEANTAELIELTCREAGKTIDDSIAEIREAVDFLRYYAAQARTLQRYDQRRSDVKWQARGTFICISPWNFPLAIFSGQIAAALVTGNCVIAKPAEQTALVASRVISLLHKAGIPRSVLQLLPGKGATIGAALVGDRRTAGVCFTGSTATALHISRALARHAEPDAPLIAETGGINAMIVDSTALPEQAVRDIVDSAFKSAGQRCSALRLLCVQRDILDRIVTMLKGAMDMLVVGDPAKLSTDLGPVIDQAAHQKITSYCEGLTNSGSLLHKATLQKDLHKPDQFIAPVLFSVDSIAAVSEEIFGPVLHVFAFDSEELPEVVNAINDKGYGLTFGLHTRVDERVQQISDSVSAGNLYINRNQIGAIVGSQPFGGHGLSGTGPKAGGPHYLLRFIRWSPLANVPNKLLNAQQELPQTKAQEKPDNLSQASLQKSLQELTDEHLKPAHIFTDNRRLFEQLLKDTSLLETLPELSQKTARQSLLALGTTLDQHHHPTIDLPGPTGESNRLTMLPAGNFLIFQHEDVLELVMKILALVSVGNAVLVTGNNAASVCQPMGEALRRVLTKQDQNANHIGLITAIDGKVDKEDLLHLANLHGVCVERDQRDNPDIRRILADRNGPILPLITSAGDLAPMIQEVTLCIDTTAAGGNASLLADVDKP